MWRRGWWAAFAQRGIALVREWHSESHTNIWGRIVMVGLLGRGSTTKSLHERSALVKLAFGEMGLWLKAHGNVIVIVVACWDENTIRMRRGCLWERYGDRTGNKIMVKTTLIFPFRPNATSGSWTKSSSHRALAYILFNAKSNPVHSGPFMKVVVFVALCYCH